MLLIKGVILKLIGLECMLRLWLMSYEDGGKAGDGKGSIQTVHVNLVDCLSFVQEGCREGKPQGQCCPGLKKVVKEEVSCLCQAFKGSADYGVKLNITKALTLPSACGVKTPPFSKCNIAFGGAPGAATVSSLAGAPSASSSIRQSVARASATSPVHSAAAIFPAPSLILQLTIAAALFCNHL